MRPVVLFLDFDGVLHPAGAVSLEGGVLHAVGAFRWLPHLKDALALLPGPVHLVVHSSWRLYWEEDAALLVQVPPELANCIKGVTPRSIASRQASIEAYCAQEGVENFVVLDDEPAAFSPGWPPLIACNPALGVSDEEAQALVWRRLRDACLA